MTSAHRMRHTTTAMKDGDQSSYVLLLLTKHRSIYLWKFPENERFDVCFTEVNIIECFNYLWIVKAML